MKGLGIALILAGIGLVAWAFTMSVAAPTEGSFGPVANNDLMNQRLLYAISGSAAFVSGWLAMILDALSPAKPVRGFEGQV